MTYTLGRRYVSNGTLTRQERSVHGFRSGRKERSTYQATVVYGVRRLRILVMAACDDVAAMTRRKMSKITDMWAKFTSTLKIEDAKLSKLKKWDRKCRCSSDGF